MQPTPHRKARSAVKVPPDYADLKQPLSVMPHNVEGAFINANPGLSRGAIAISCARKRDRSAAVPIERSAISRLPGNR
jgi:ribonuclease I